MDRITGKRPGIGRTSCHSANAPFADIQVSRYYGYRMTITNTKWLSLGMGGIAVWAALGLPAGLISPEVGNPLFLFAIMAIIDFGISGKVLTYATMNGPQERKEELDRRFYSWRRTRLRYIYIVTGSLLVYIGVQIEGLGDWYLYSMIAVITGYMALAIQQMFVCREEASLLYQPDGR